MNVRIAVVDGLAIAVIVIVGLDILRRVHSNDRSDTADVHRVRADGTEPTLICSAPAFECVLDPIRH